MRSTLACAALLAAVSACKQEPKQATEPPATVGGEIVARRAPAPPRGVGSTTLAITNSELDIFVIDVGQGDSTLVVGPLHNGERIAMLIDGGDDSSDEFVEPLLAQVGVQELEFVVASHYDSDHVGGFTTVSESSALWTTADDANGELASCTPRPLFPSDAIVDPQPKPRQYQDRAAVGFLRYRADRW